MCPSRSRSPTPWASRTAVACQLTQRGYALRAVLTLFLKDARPRPCSPPPRYERASFCRQQWACRRTEPGCSSRPKRGETGIPERATILRPRIPVPAVAPAGARDSPRPGPGGPHPSVRVRREHGGGQEYGDCAEGAGGRALSGATQRAVGRPRSWRRALGCARTQIRWRTGRSRGRSERAGQLPTVSDP